MIGIIAILFVALIAVLTYIVLRKRYEGYQTLTAEEEAAARERETKIQEIIMPRPTDYFQIEFPRPFVEWAVNRRPSDSADVIRSDLLEHYDDRLADFQTTPSEVTTRDAMYVQNPKAESCKQATDARDAYLAALTRLRSPVQDLSANLFTAVMNKDINRDYQQEVKDKCIRSQSPNCLALAQQDNKLVEAIPWYESVNTSIFDKEVTIQENIEVLNKVLDILQCSKILDQSTQIYDLPNGKVADPKNLRKHLGYIDTPLLRLKLTEMSPYYISPAVLQYITQYLINSEEVNSKINTLQSTSDSIRAISTRIKAYTG